MTYNNRNNQSDFKQPEIQDEFEGFVKRVIDGDTYEITKENDTETLYVIRLWNCDVPEKRQLLGDKISQHVEKFLVNRKITFQLIDSDNYGRNVGKLLLHEPQNRKQDFAEYLVFKGFAYATSENNDDPYYRLQRDAEFNKKGVWGLQNPKKPDEFRAEKYNRKIKMIPKEDTNKHKFLGKNKNKKNSFKR